MVLGRWILYLFENFVHRKPQVPALTPCQITWKPQALDTGWCTLCTRGVQLSNNPICVANKALLKPEAYETTGGRARPGRCY